MNRKILIFIAFLLSLSAVSALTCGVYNTSQSGTLIMSLSNETNAHGELPTESNYTWYVYCENASYTIGTSCDANPLNLSNATNAHGSAIPSAGYTDQVCISVVETGIECTYASGSLPVGYECLVTMNNETNAHFSSCDDPYDILVGCRFADSAFPTWKDNATNETETTPRYNEFITLNVTLNDDLDLNSYTFSWNNSGSWVNDSSVDISGTEHNVSISKQVARTRDDIIAWRVWFNDSSGNENVTDVFEFIVKNTAPDIPVLDRPEDNETTIDLTPLFNWTSSDIDNDPLTYNISIECLNGCAVDNRNATVTEANYTPSELQYYADDGYTYRWRVQACDDLDCSEYSEWRSFNLSSFVSINFTQDTINFNDIAVGMTNDTELDDPAPFILQNIGNVPVNVTYYADNQLYDRASLPSTFFRARVRVGNYTSAQTTYIEIPSVSSPQDLLRELEREGNATIDVEVTVPLDEPPGIKTSTTVAVAVRS